MRAIIAYTTHARLFIGRLNRICIICISRRIRRRDRGIKLTDAGKCRRAGLKAEVRQVRVVDRSSRRSGKSYPSSLRAREYSARIRLPREPPAVPISKSTREHVGMSLLSPFPSRVAHSRRHIHRRRSCSETHICLYANPASVSAQVTTSTRRSLGQAARRRRGGEVGYAGTGRRTRN